jgi:hypothetical protein
MVIICNFFCIGNILAKTLYSRDVTFVGLREVTYPKACSILHFGALKLTIARGLKI